MDECYQSDRHGHLPEIEKGVLVRLTDCVINSSARSVFIETWHRIKEFQEEKQVVSRLTLIIGTDQRLPCA
jgi:hypothetical protein